MISKHLCQNDVFMKKASIIREFLHRVYHHMDLDSNKTSDKTGKIVFWLHPVTNLFIMKITVRWGNCRMIYGRIQYGHFISGDACI